MARTITSATAQFALSVGGLYPQPQNIHGYSSDDAFEGEAVENAEVVMGVDANMSVGWVPNPVKQIIVLQADSDSIDIFNNWGVTQQGLKEVLIAQATIYIPGTGYKYALSKGVLTSWRPLPQLKKVIQPQRYEITWERVVGALLPPGG